jgi:hypothetical protein
VKEPPRPPGRYALGLDGKRRGGGEAAHTHAGSINLAPLQGCAILRLYQYLLWLIMIIRGQIDPFHTVKRELVPNTRLPVALEWHRWV